MDVDKEISWASDKLEQAKDYVMNVSRHTEREILKAYIRKLEQSREVH